MRKIKEPQGFESGLYWVFENSQHFFRLQYIMFMYEVLSIEKVDAQSNTMYNVY